MQLQDCLLLEFGIALLFRNVALIFSNTPIRGSWSSSLGTLPSVNGSPGGPEFLISSFKILVSGQFAFTAKKISSRDTFVGPLVWCSAL